MPITTLPTQAEFEGPKALKPGGHPIPDADKTYGLRVAALQAILDRIIEAETEIGLSDGSTPGSLWERIGAGVQTIATSATIAASTGVVVIAPAGPTAVTLTLPDISSGAPKILYVHRTQAPGGTTFARSGTDTIWDDVNAAPVTSYVPRDGTQARAAWLLFGAAGMWRVWRISSPSELADVAMIGASDGSTPDTIWEAIRGSRGRGEFPIFAPGTIPDNVETVIPLISGGTITMPPLETTAGLIKRVRIWQSVGTYFDLASDPGDSTQMFNNYPSPISLPLANTDVWWELISIGDNPGFGWLVRSSRADSTRTVSSASDTIDATTSTNVSYSGGTCTLALPNSPWACEIGETRRIRKTNASAFGIVLTPNAGGSINGGAANASFVLPGSTRPSATTTGDQWWDVTRTNTLEWRVSGGSPRYDTSGNVDLGAGNLATSGTVDGRDVSVDGAKLDLITSGTYTPTGTIVSNLDAVTPLTFRYQRVGSIVFCSGRVTVDPTAASAFSYALSLPIASNLGSINDAAGTVSGGHGYGDATNDRIEFSINAAGTSAFTQSVFFSYTVI